MRHALILIATVVSLPSLAAEPPAGPANLSTAKHWVRVQSQSQIDAIHAKAVEDAAMQFSWAIRGFARPKLQGAAETCSEYRIHTDSDFHWQCESHPPNRRTPGTATSYTNENGTYTLRMSRSGQSWTADYNDGDSGKKVTWTFVSETKLVLTQEVYSSQLSKPMRWTVEFKPGP